MRFEAAIAQITGAHLRAVRPRPVQSAQSDAYRSAMAEWTAASRELDAVKRQHPQYGELADKLRLIEEHAEDSGSRLSGEPRDQAEAIHRELNSFAKARAPAAYARVKMARHEVRRLHYVAP